MAKRRKRHSGVRRSGSRRARELPELAEARALWIQRRYPESLRMFDKALRKDRDNPIALADAARAFGSRFEFERAEQLLLRLVQLAEDQPELLQMAGQSYRMIQRPHLAISCLEQALESSPQLHAARLELAMLYERRHDLDAALQHVEAALEQSPDAAEARLLRGRILRRLERNPEAELILRDVAESEGVHPIVRAQAWHDLGQLFDAAGRFDEAFAAVVAGKQLQRGEAQSAIRDGKRESDGLENLLNRLTPIHFQHWRDAAKGLPAKRVALLTGLPRSGTTLLERVLDSHPEFFTSDEQVALPKFVLPSFLVKKAPNEFLAPEDLDAAPMGKIGEERDRCFRYLGAARGEPIGDRLLIDKNPSIIMLIPALLRLFPEAKLLIAIRDPRDVAVSCFMRYLPMNSVSAQFLTIEGVAQRYARDMEAWFRLRELQAAPYIEIRYEDAVANLEREARRAVEFLGADWDDQVMNYRGRLDDRQVNSPTYEDVAKPVYRSAIGRWRHYQKHLEPILDQMCQFAAALDYDV